MIASRAIVVLIDTRFWVLGISMVYCVYGISLLRNIVNKRLPYIDHLEACSMIFLATKNKMPKVVHPPSFDVASTPECALLVLTAALFVITSVAEYANPPGLSLPLLRFGDRAELPSRVIPIVVWLFVAFAGSIHGHVRAAYLDTQSLLMVQLWHMLSLHHSTYPKYWQVLRIYVSLQWAYCCGELQAPAALAVFALGPLCVIISLRAFSIWLANDCEVVIWPPATEDVPK